jgi:hypothetical protein
LFLLHLRDCDLAKQFKRPKLQFIGTCLHSAQNASFSPILSGLIRLTIEVNPDGGGVFSFSQPRIGMDSSAIYVSAVNDHLCREEWWQKADHRQKFMSVLAEEMMKWKWCDYVTGKPLAYAFDGPPAVPDTCTPTSASITWKDLPVGKEFEAFFPSQPAGARDCVLAYQYGPPETPHFPGGGQSE